MNIGDKFKNSNIFSAINFIFSKYKLFLCFIIIIYFSLIGFLDFAEIFCIVFKLNRLQSEICYNIFKKVGYLSLFLYGIRLGIKKYRYVDILFIALMILTLLVVYKKYMFFKEQYILSIKTLIYIFYPFINYISLLIGIISGKIILKN
ncbi:MAG: hypothetical protein Q4D26_12490 [Clostridia bacterium]|nr:hypothetical protein [Clostridia bacterium]